jgi:hypothetical protein
MVWVIDKRAQLLRVGAKVPSPAGATQVEFHLKASD